MSKRKSVLISNGLICLVVSMMAIGCGGDSGSDGLYPSADGTPYVAITEPSDCSTYYVGDSIVFTGDASYENISNRNVQYVWTSDKDGQIGTGSSFETNSLSEGAHEINLSIFDDDGTNMVDTIKLSIVSEQAIVDTVFVGKGPAYLAMTPDGEHVYVPNALDDTVSVIKTSDNSIIKTMAVGDIPVAVEILSNGRIAYVSNANENTVSVIQTSDNTVIQTIDVGYQPWGMTATKNGDYAYVVNGDYPNVSVIQTNSCSEIGQIAPYPGAHQSPDTRSSQYSDIAISADGNYLYIAASANITITPDDTYYHSDGEVMVVQTSDYTIMDTISIGDLPTRITLAPDGEHVYVTNAQDNSVSIIQTVDNTLIGEISVGIHPDDIAITSNGEYIFVANNTGNSITKIRSSDYAIVDTYAVGAKPWGIVISPNSKYIYVSNFEDNTVLIIDTEI